MTQLKKLKKAIRARSRKTGESYAAARRQVLEARGKRAVTRARTRASLPPTEPSARSASPVALPKNGTKGAVSESAILQKTGHGLGHWFAVLDTFGAAEKGHTAAATHLRDAHKVSGWHAQGITVAYERARGLRAMNQSCTGAFQVSASKAIPATVAEVAEAIGRLHQRAAWLADVDPDLARALQAAFKGSKPRSVTMRDATHARLRYPWDGSAVELRITGKPKGGSTVVADNVDLPDVSAVEDRRAKWRVALEALKTHFSR